MYFERCHHCQTDIELGSKICPHCLSEIQVENEKYLIDLELIETNKISTLKNRIKNVLKDVFGVLGVTIITYMSIFALFFMLIRVVIYIFQGMLENIFRGYKG